MAMYRVTWEIDIDDETPRGAAVQALDIHRDPNSIATVFMVYDASGSPFKVDLASPQYVVDGHEFDQTEAPDAWLVTGGLFPPFRVFSVDTQEHIGGDYRTRDEAQAAADKLNGLPERIVVRDGAIWKGNKRLLVIARGQWGDEAPSHAELAEAEAELARIVAAHYGST